ncbi:MAG: hypothetical protein ACRD3W_30590, partial [Terriglobales bacterium]
QSTAREEDWLSLAKRRDLSWPVPVIAAVRPVFAIVITQDCDAVRSADIALCEIQPFKDVHAEVKAWKDRPDAEVKLKNWIKAITQHSRSNQKWYYLPPAANLGFDTRMAVDFRTVLRVGREDLECFRDDLRIARLNDVANAHFRERIGEFFRRYAYDEWYPLDIEEFEIYQDACPESVDPFPWQIRTVTAVPAAQQSVTPAVVSAGQSVSTSDDGHHEEAQKPSVSWHQKIRRSVVDFIRQKFQR